MESMSDSIKEGRTLTLYALEHAMERLGETNGLVVSSETRDHFEPDDVLVLRFAANDSVQLAAASPKFAEQSLMKAARLTNLADQIARVLAEGK